MKQAIKQIKCSLILSVFYLLFSSCVEYRFDRAVYEFSNSVVDSTIINLADITPFEWDTLYFFSDGWSPFEIDSLVGKPICVENNIDCTVTENIFFMYRGCLEYFEQWEYSCKKSKYKTFFLTDKRWMKVNIRDAIFVLRTVVDTRVLSNNTISTSDDEKCIQEIKRRGEIWIKPWVW